MNKPFYKISKEEYQELLRDSYLLGALISGGVDGWKGYELSIMNDLKDEYWCFKDKYDQFLMTDKEYKDLVYKNAEEDCLYAFENDEPVYYASWFDYNLVAKVYIKNRGKYFF